MTSDVADEIKRALAVLRRGAQVIETRLLGVPRDGTLSGFFDDDDKLIAAIDPYDGRCNCYVVMNEVPAELLARANNRLQRPTRDEISTKDHEVARRRWVLIDCDAGQSAGIPSSDEEVENSRHLRRAIVEWLTELGWPDPVLADSGNGAHALYPIDLPNTTTGKANAPDPSASVIRRVLLALESRFPAGEFGKAKIDTSVFNASRLTRLYGTINVRGDGMVGRPHRRSRLT